MKRTIKLRENELRNMISESIKNYLYEAERQYNKGDYVGGRNGVITDQLGVTYEQVRDVYAALYGYNNRWEKSCKENKARIKRRM